MSESGSISWRNKPRVGSRQNGKYGQYVSLDDLTDDELSEFVECERTDWYRAWFQYLDEF